ncbi:MAG: hypothetical protein BWY70_00459 [Bacteroidetes bacterium ADurb.Bin408]|nr:MAG: hypothetical protein BWY70_00459 [Bacteroidetes bacterium ADurb.Bin408]
MKNKYLFPLLFAFFLSNSVSKAQNYVPFPDSNAVWSQIKTNDYGQSDKYQYRISGDTIISSVQYHKLFMQYDSLLNFSNSIYVGAIREQSKKIFFLHSYCQNETRLYDFTKNVGDTINNLYDEDSYCVGVPASGIVNSIDSILIDGNYRKVFHLNAVNNPVWIEGIGSIYGLLNSVEPTPTCICNWYLVCFQQNDSVKYLNPNFSSCFPVITDMPNQAPNKTSVNIFPNPVVGESIIKWDIPGNYKYSTLIITDALGKNIKTINVSGKNEITINRNDYKQGLYFGRLITTNGESYFIKFIIQ